VETGAALLTALISKVRVFFLTIQAKVTKLAIAAEMLTAIAILLVVLALVCAFLLFCLIKFHTPFL
jgi:hypothetical protein